MSRSSTRTPCGGILEGKCCERRVYRVSAADLPALATHSPRPATGTNARSAGVSIGRGFGGPRGCAVSDLATPPLSVAVVCGLGFLCGCSSLSLERASEHGWPHAGNEDDNEEDLDGEGGELVDVDFDFFDPKPDDFHGLRALLQNYLDASPFDVSGFTDAIIEQNTVREAPLPPPPHATNPCVASLASQRRSRAERFARSPAMPGRQTVE